MVHIVQNVGYTFAIHNRIGCLKYTLTQPKSMVTNRKHKKHTVLLIPLHMRDISPHLSPTGGPNGLLSVQRKDSIFGCIKIFLQFLAILHKKHKKYLGKTYLSHVPINRSHQMNNHFWPSEVTTCEINTEMFRKYDIFLLNVQK